MHGRRREAREPSSASRPPRSRRSSDFNEGIALRVLSARAFHSGRPTYCKGMRYIVYGSAASPSDSSWCSFLVDNKVTRRNVTQTHRSRWRRYDVLMFIQSHRRLILITKRVPTSNALKPSRASITGSNILTTSPG
jgi:hypothetical protein